MRNTEDTETIECLKKRQIWVCWNYVIKDGSKTKVPISAHGNKTGTDKAHSDTWVTFDEAEDAAARNGYDGVGFIIPEGYFFLDIDHMNLSDPFVQLLLERFHSYAEHSISGNGAHIYGECNLSVLPTESDDKGIHLARGFYTKNPNNGIELYIGGITNRFAVYTGNVIMDEPLRDCTQAVLTTLDKDMRRKQKAKYSPKCDGDNRDTFDIVCNLRKQKIILVLEEHIRRKCYEEAWGRAYGPLPKL